MDLRSTGQGDEMGKKEAGVGRACFREGRRVWLPARAPVAPPQGPGCSQLEGQGAWRRLGDMLAMCEGLACMSIKATLFLNTFLLISERKGETTMMRIFDWLPPGTTPTT